METLSLIHSHEAFGRGGHPRHRPNLRGFFFEIMARDVILSVISRFSNGFRATHQETISIGAEKREVIRTLCS